MKNGIIYSVIVILCLFSISFATSTIWCTSKNGKVEILIHVGSEYDIADVALFISKDVKFIYYPTELYGKIFKWEKYEKPFDKNALHILSKGNENGKPQFEIKVDGEKGTLIFNNMEYEIECDWSG